MTTNDPNARQVGGNHYKGVAVQHWDLAVLYGWDAFQYQVTKYVMRWRGKNGLQDLEKAQHFIEKYIAEVKAGRIVTGDPQRVLPRKCWLDLLGVVDGTAYDQLRAELLACACELTAARNGAPTVRVDDVFAVPRGAVKPTGWVAFTFEGSKDDKDEFKCTKCKAHFTVPCNTPPLVHVCQVFDDVSKLDRSEIVTGRHRDGTPVVLPPADLQLEAPLVTHTDGTEPGRTYVAPG